MNEVKKFLDARRQLMIDHGVGKVGFIEFATRGGSLVELIDEARAPVADKALSLWLENGCAEYWLKTVVGDEILAAARVPTWVLDNGRLYISSAVIDSSKFTICTNVGEGGKLYAAGFGAGVDAQEMLDKMGDCIARTSLGEDLKAEIDKIDARGGHTINMTINVDGSSIKGAVERGISEVIYPLREDCADAAQWFYQVKDAAMPGGPQWLKNNPADRIISRARAQLDALNSKRQPVADAAWFLLEYGVADWHDILADRSADHILYCAKARQDTISAKREPIADAAQVLFTVFGYNASQVWSLSDPVATLSLQGPNRRGTIIAVRRLGTPAAGAEVRVNFYKDGEPVSSHLISGKVSEASYCRHVWVCDYDEYRVIGDACVSVEAVYESR